MFGGRDARKYVSRERERERERKRQRGVGRSARGKGICMPR